MDQILTIILKDSFSLIQLKNRLRILKSNLLQTYFGGTTEAIPTATGDANWLKSLSQDFYQKFNKDNVYQIFSDLEKMIAKLPTLTIYLVFEPDDPTLNQIGSYSRRTFASPTLLLDIKIDPRLIAGTALAWKGVYKDYSLRMKIEGKKVEIAEGFRRFLR